MNVPNEFLLPLQRQAGPSSRALLPRKPQSPVALPGVSAKKALMRTRLLIATRVGNVYAVLLFAGQTAAKQKPRKVQII